ILIVVVSSIVLALRGEAREEVLTDLKATIREGLPGDASGLIIGEMDRLRESTGLGVIAFGWGFMFWSGRTMLLTVSSGLDAAYGVDQRRKAWHRNAIAAGLILLTVFSLLGLSVVLQFTADELLLRLNPDGPWGWIRTAVVYGFKWVLAIGFLLAAVSMVYTFVPSCKLRWTALTPGGAFFAATFLIATQLFRLYIQSVANYGDTYGALAGLVVLMTWLWGTGALLLFGGQLNSVIHRHALAELFRKDRERIRAGRRFPPIGAISDPTPAEMDEDLRRDEQERTEEADAERLTSRRRENRPAEGGSKRPVSARVIAPPSPAIVAAPVSARPETLPAESDETP
ncbi:MAG: YihY/virulence factor BrkB family protein, partial [Planctomycetota bacterium]